MNSRRKFLQNSAIMAGGTLLASALDNNAFAIFKNGIAPSDQLNIGAIGVNGMGWADTTSALKIPGVNLVAICDIDQNVIVTVKYLNGKIRTAKFKKFKSDLEKGLCKITS